MNGRKREERPLRRKWVFTRGVASTGAVLALLVATAIASAAPTQPLPSVEIAWPPPGTATNTDMLAVDVRFEAEGNVHLVALELDGREVGQTPNPPSLKSGSYAFAVPFADVADGTHHLQAFAYQGDERAGLRGASARVPVLLDRAPPLLELDVSDGTFAAEPRIVVRGSVSDALSGVASLTCNGSPVAIAAAFACEVALAEGANEVVVRATDRAGNVATRRLTVHHQPGGLAGAPDTPALDAVEDVFAPQALVTPAEVTESVIRTQLELVLARDADIAAVNALLRRIGGRIVSSREGVLIAVVRIPDPGSLDALQALVASLALDPALRAAEPALMPSPDALPDIVAPGTADVEFLRSQLAVGAHAAWNARAALDSVTPPTLVVADFFGGGPPGSLFGVTPTSADFATTAVDEHGWMVLGIAAGAFDPVGAALAADAVTGIYPGTIPLRVADVKLGLAGATLDDRILELVESAPGDVVVNTSLGSRCDTPARVAAFCTPATAAGLALRWIERVRGSDPADPGANLENDFVHATSAGNVASSVGPIGATVNSKWAAAALLSPLVDPGSGLTVANLSNTLVVESFTATATKPFRAGCTSPTAETGGTIAAIGSPVHSSDSPTTARNHGDGGSSAATPQVAGTAAYVWALAPGLTPTQVVRLLETTARPSSAGCGGAPVLDAYAALLAADAGTARPVRSALVDADDDGDFDQADLAPFVDAFRDAGGTIDYGRHDLNGDGRTGGDTRDRFDLDADTGPDRWSDTQEQTIQTIPVRFEDAGLTDLEILCYYAHTDLYDGDPAVRDQFAAEQCLTLTLDASFPSTVEADRAYELIVRARRPNGLLQPGVHLQLAAIGGSVADTAGFTDTSGVFRTNGRLLAGATELRIEIVARAGASGAELSRKTVSAGAAGPLVPIGVTITPTSATVGPGETIQFTATVDGSSNRVMWSSSAGSITDTGLLSPPTVETPLTVTVTARSRDDLSKSASASIVVIPQSAWIGRWVGTATSLVFGEMRTEPTIVTITKTNPFLRVSNLELGTRSGRFIMFPGLALLPGGITRLPDSTTAASSKIHGLPSRLANCFASEVCRVDGTLRGDALSLTLVPLVAGPRHEEYSLVREAG